MARIGSTKIFVLALVCTLSACATSNTQQKEQRQENQEKIASVNTQIAIAYMRDGDNQLAVNKLEKAIEADPNYAPAHSTLGWLYHRVGEHKKAEKYFLNALKIEPKSSAILNNYGQVLCQNGEYEKGQEMFLRARNNPLYASPEVALTNAGICAMDAKDLTGAETFLREALELNPRVSPALLRMSMISFDTKRYLQARAYLQRYIEFSPHTAQSLWLGIRVERELGDKDALATYKLKLEKGFPDSNEARLLAESETP